MSLRSIVVTRPDQQRLQELLRSQFGRDIGQGRPHITELEEMLATAQIVEANSVCPDIVTMNSTIKLLDLITQDSETITLVYPHEANIDEGKLSVLSPLGTELLGRRVTEEVAFSLLNRKTNKRVEKIWYQPERVGAFNL